MEVDEPLFNSSDSVEQDVPQLNLPPLDKYGKIVDVISTAYGDAFFVQASTDKEVCHTLIVHGEKIYELGTGYEPGKLIQKGNHWFVKIDNHLFALEQIDSGYKLRHIIELINYHEPVWQYFDDPFSPDGRYLILRESYPGPHPKNSFIDVVDLGTGERWRAFESQMSTGAQWIVVE